MPNFPACRLASHECYPRLCAGNTSIAGRATRVSVVSISLSHGLIASTHLRFPPLLEDAATARGMAISSLPRCVKNRERPETQALARA